MPYVAGDGGECGFAYVHSPGRAVARTDRLPRGIPTALIKITIRVYVHRQACPGQALARAERLRLEGLKPAAVRERLRALQAMADARQGDMSLPYAQANTVPVLFTS